MATVASDQNTAAISARARPQCQHGSSPKHSGPADPTQAQANDAANFTCTAY